MENSGNVKEYFLRRSENFYILKTAAFHSNRPTYFESYSKSKMTFSHKLHFYKGDRWIYKYFFSLVYYFYVMFKYIRNISQINIVVIHPLYCTFNRFFSLFINFKLVFWIWDFFPQNKGLMSVYHMLVNHYNKSLNYFLYLSPYINRIYNLKDGKIRILAPFGLKKKYAKSEVYSNKRFSLGFIGIIKKGQGLEKIFDYLSKVNHNVILNIIGEGPELNYYTKIAKELKIEHKVKFWGFLKEEKIKSVFRRVDIGVALYDNSNMNVSKYSDSGKIKLFLEYGLPVLVTKTNYFYHEIKKYNAGRVITRTDEIEGAIADIENNFKQYANGVKSLIKKYKYISIYDRYFDFLK